MKYENFMNLVRVRGSVIYYIEEDNKYTLKTPGGLLLFETSILKTEEYVTVEEQQLVSEEGGDPVSTLRIKGGEAYSGDLNLEKKRMEDFETNYKTLETTLDIS